MNVIWLIILALVFLASAAIPILLPYVGGAMPRVVRQLLGDIWLWIVLTAQGDSQLCQLENGRYVLEPSSTGDVEPARNWARLKTTNVALTYERCREAFGRTIAADAQDKIDAARDAGKKLRERFVQLGEKRAGDRQAAPANPEENSLLVRMDQFLKQYQHASVDEGRVDVEQVSLTEHGGDTGGNSNRMRFIGVFLMSIMGIAVGYVLFFGF